MPRPQLDPIRALIVTANPADHSRLLRMLRADEAMGVAALTVRAQDVLDASSREDAHDALVEADVIMLDADENDSCPWRSLVGALAQECPTTSVVMLTRGNEDKALWAAMGGNVVGVLTKDEYPRSIAIALRRACRGEPVVSSRPMRLLIQAFRTSVGAESAHQSHDDDEPASLPPHLRSVYGLLLGGQSNRRIARSLSITENTARVYVSDVLHRLGYSSRTELIAGALP